MAYEPRPMSDPRVLRAIAHPTRGRILDELGATGPMRAADVGEALGIPANQASFHLRQLAKYGVIEPAPEAARDKRDRVWKLPEERGFQLDVQSIEAQPGGKAAVSVFRQNKAAWAHRLVDEVFSFRKHKDTFSAIVDQTTKLTKDEAAEFMGEVDEVLARWADKTRGRGGGRRTYVFYSMLMPYPEDEKRK
ncbi:MAG TPA: helix-turn-helix domain-containing protein [Nocardioides sp.]|jgi:predicted ArsR family transcriptional regulator|nr:helix-turn-helix domain-containing protein [Nocardioides sp.]